MTKNELMLFHSHFRMIEELLAIIAYRTGRIITANDERTIADLSEDIYRVFDKNQDLYFDALEEKSDCE